MKVLLIFQQIKNKIIILNNIGIIQHVTYPKTILTYHNRFSFWYIDVLNCPIVNY